MKFFTFLALAFLTTFSPAYALRMATPQEMERNQESSTRGYIKIDDIKGESNDRVAYVLCPDGTMIQPGEKCSEEKEIEGGEPEGDPVPGIGITAEQGVSAEIMMKGEDEDCDGDTCVQSQKPMPMPYIKIDDIKGETQREPMMDTYIPAELMNPVVVDVEDEDCEGDACDPTRATDYNSSRSNRTTSAAIEIEEGDNDEEGEKERVEIQYLFETEGALLAEDLASVVAQVAPEFSVREGEDVFLQERKGTIVAHVPSIERRAFLGLFKMNMKVKVLVDNNGELVNIKRPWYSFLSW